MRIRQRRCPIFMVKIQQSFVFGALWCTGRVSCLCIQCMPTWSCYGEPEPLKASSILMRITYAGKPMSLRWHGSRQSHHNNHAHNIAWICTYNNCLECIPIQQGQEHSWLERATFIVTRVHHTKCTITHIKTYIDIDTSSTKRESKIDKCQCSRGMVQQGIRNVN